MCEPISIGIAIGAATGAISSAVTGGDPLKGALMGAVVGGVTGGMGGLGAGTTASTIGGNLGSQSFFQAMNMALPATLSSQALVGFAATSLVGGIGLGMMTPEQQNYNLGATALPYGPQAYSSQHSTVTGSGGRQAAAVLASEIKQAKSLRQRQAGVADYGLGMDVAGTGLQIA